MIVVFGQDLHAPVAPSANVCGGILKNDASAQFDLAFQKINRRLIIPGNTILPRAVRLFGGVFGARQRVRTDAAGVGGVKTFNKRPGPFF